MSPGSPLRVVVTGSECTGKTTLAARLGERFGAVWVPEFARSYADAKGAPLDATDVEPIALGQRAAEDEGEARATALLVLDTDLLSTMVYARHYYGSCPAWIAESARSRRAPLYLLCHPDVPWAADGVRDRGEARGEMHALFRTAVAALGPLGSRVVDVRGSWSEREETAARAVRDALAERFTR